MKLKEGGIYTIYDIGSDMLLDEYRYIGFNRNLSEHIFRSDIQFNEDSFICIPDKDIEDSVLELSKRLQRDKKLNNILYENNFKI